MDSPKLTDAPMLKPKLKSSQKWTITILSIILILLIVAAIVILVLWWRGYEFYDGIVGSSATQCRQLDYDCVMYLTSKYKNVVIEWAHRGYGIRMQLSSDGMKSIEVDTIKVHLNQNFNLSDFLKIYYSLGDIVYVNGKRFL